MSEIGTTLRLIREAKRISVKRAAEAIGTTARIYESIEAGNLGLSEDDVDRLSVVLRCPANAILGVSLPKPYRDSATVEADCKAAAHRLYISMQQLRDSLNTEGGNG